MFPQNVPIDLKGEQMQSVCSFILQDSVENIHYLIKGDSAREKILPAITIPSRPHGRIGLDRADNHVAIP